MYENVIGKFCLVGFGERIVLRAIGVHFVGPDRGVFPRGSEDPRGEELRLWYVAVTRARETFTAHTAEEVPTTWGSGVQRAGASAFVEYLKE